MRGKQGAQKTPFLLPFAAIEVPQKAANTKPNGADVELSLLSVLEGNNDGED
jgi:hypothetical protein